ncbi:MAG: radical SAM family heme chaperone HemW [Deltaproteobacteria bacterium]
MERPGLYIHVPFCRSKCPYCDFYSLANTSLMRDWLKAVTLEMHLYEDRFGVFDTLYLGGGSPTFLPDGYLEILMSTLRERFAFAPDSELSIEANPGDLTSQRILLLKALGFNRINVGVQSFRDQELSFLGRRHTADEAVAAVSRLQTAGFENGGIDLIYGMPGQDIEQWLITLETALSFAPAHLSCYQLTIAEGTRFGQMREKGRLAPIGEELEREFFLRTAEFLTSRGYLHYEISNFAREAASVCRHNEKYWHHVPYLGLGPSAHSYLGDRRWWNVRSVKNYCNALKAGRVPVEGDETLSPGQLRLESVALGLRTKNGFSSADILSRTEQKRLEEMESQGLLRRQGNRVVPTMEGFLLADRIPLYLCEDMQP